MDTAAPAAAAAAPAANVAPAPVLKYDDHLKLGLEKKDLGNNAFRSGNDHTNEAIRYYHEAILYLQTIVRPPAASGKASANDAMAASLGAGAGTGSKSIPEAVKAEATSNLIAVYSNLAACHARNEKWARVIDCCNKALALDPKHVKSLYRKGVALARQGRSDHALVELRKALDLAPNDASIIKEMHACKSKERESNERLKKEMGGMFNRGPLY
ncbi:hypothetical protein H9P43_008501 [Blastocladiella emersonii ATCC 22665]|nr:hypothetical protein H9P43_008501 [Blastocladiella emersonii ATCC 22665]